MRGDSTNWSQSALGADHKRSANYVQMESAEC